jgi:hypothetical protein
MSDERWMRRGGGAETREKRALQIAVLSRLEKCNALFSGEMRAFLIAAWPIRNRRVEARGAGSCQALRGCRWQASDAGQTPRTRPAVAGQALRVNDRVYSFIF